MSAMASQITSPTIVYWTEKKTAQLRVTGGELTGDRSIPRTKG